MLHYKVHIQLLDFPGGPVDKNLPADAGDRFDPWAEMIPHASGQLSLCAPAMEPIWRNHWNPVSPRYGAPQQEKPPQ